MPLMELGPQDVADIALGAAFLGSGGGGDPYCGRLMVEMALADGCRLRLIDPDELPDDALVIPTGMMGSPTVLAEKLPRGDELLLALRRLESHLGRPAFATMPLEIGGINSMLPLYVAARLGLPVVDADGMGRAFPELQMETFHVYGVLGTPMAICSEQGDSVLLKTRDNRMMESLARGATIRLGGTAYIAEFPMDGQTVRRTAVPRTISLSLEIGRCLREAAIAGVDPVEALREMLRTTLYRTVVVIVEGKVVDLLRETTRGFARGKVIIETERPSRPLIELVFQNEYLLARQNGRVRAVVPDLLCVLDRRSSAPIATELIRFGQQVRVVAVSAPPMMRTPEALAVFGPRAFGLAERFRPVEELVEEWV